MKVGSLFSGIGGIDLGLERAGMTIAWQVEINPFCRRVLEKHWPHVPKYGDIRLLRGDELEPVDIICGGFPCQPFSVAGKRRGKEDDRYLWPEMLQLIKELRPRWVLGENVVGIIGMALDDVLSDLESTSYTAQAFVIPACAVGAPHRRDRVWIVAHSTGVERQSGAEEQGVLRRVPEDGEECGNAGRPSEAQFPKDVAYATRQLPHGSGKPRRGWKKSADCGEDVADTNQQGSQGHRELRECTSKSPVRSCSETNEKPRFLESRLGGVFDGLSSWLDGHRWPAPFGCEQYDWEPPRLAQNVPNRTARLKALGNAVVPQVVEVIGRAIMEADRRRSA